MSRNSSLTRVCRTERLSSRKLRSTNRISSRIYRLGIFLRRAFVKVVAYIDESGTHDKTGKRQGSAVAVICGLVAWRHDWAQFCTEWEAVLNKYGAPYFHFFEWSTASRVTRGKIKAPSDYGQNPYREWSHSKLNAFLYDLASITGGGNKVIVGGYVYTSDFHAAKTSRGINPKIVPAGGDPYKHVVDQFFEKLPGDILSAWPYWNEPVSILYDWSGPEWKRAICDAHERHKVQDPRIAELVFADKKVHLPLQAADMVAYRFRQLAENLRENKLQLEPLPKLDELLLKSMFGQFGTVGPPLST